MKKHKDTTQNTTYHLEEFQPYLDDVDIPEDQKHAFLALIWSIMVEFVALGFGADATSQAIAAHLADALDSDSTAEKSPDKLTGIFTATQPTKTKNDCEARL